MALCPGLSAHSGGRRRRAGGGARGKSPGEDEAEAGEHERRSQLRIRRRLAGRGQAQAGEDLRGRQLERRHRLVMRRRLANDRGWQEGERTHQRDPTEPRGVRGPQHVRRVVDTDDAENHPEHWRYEDAVPIARRALGVLIVTLCRRALPDRGVRLTWGPTGWQRCHLHGAGARRPRNFRVLERHGKGASTF